jgi:putative membrane protein
MHSFLRELLGTGNRSGREPDYRFTLANERTFLAYVRTALGLDAAGIAVTQFVHPSSSGLRTAIAVAAIGLGTAVSGLGYVRWRQNEEAMRAEGPLPPLRLALVLGAGMIVLSTVALVLVLTSN